MNTKLPTTCAVCDKRTNVRNRSDQNPDLCKNCFAREELELDHENHEDDGPIKNCPVCEQDVLDGVHDEDDTPAEDAPVVTPNSKHFSHANCDHPSTPKDRAQCRKDGAAAKFHQK